MSGSTPPGSLPPEVPEEFAAAYRAAYERALAAQSEGPQHSAQPERDDDHDTDELPVRRGRLVVGTHRTEQYDDEPTFLERITDSPWLVPVLLALLALLLILGAYAVGRAFAGKVTSDETSSAEPSVVMSDGSNKSKQPVSTAPPGKGAWDGKTQRVAGVKGTADCTSAPGRDASGAKVSYSAANLSDGVADTTWRCDGTAIGEKLNLKLPKRMAIGEVGLIPGYAKTDEASGADRYAENNRITRVRWTIGKIVVDQKLNGSAQDRSLRLLRVPRTDADEVQLEILSVVRGPRNTTAISEVQIGKAVG